MKILSYNVNGLRAALSKGFINWLQATNADMVCLQEIKIAASDIDISIFAALGYKTYCMHAEKKGYSGVAILTKIEPDNVVYGCEISKYDCEGRVIRADFKDFSLMSVYMPSGSSGEHRQWFKMEWLEDFYDYVTALKKELPNLIISGDYNICHQPIDIHNPKSNKNSSGFLPEEREWISKFLSMGFIDTFRHFNPEPHNYTWWSYRFKARDKNLGWRIDYHMASEGLKERLQRSAILCEAKHSDHCPVLLELN
ncbi:MAG: exodeoxyribonuclease III [Bacteroidota bacterium]|nr:exodeoxyribonuclease III [Bacteroidota bacterium]